MKLFVDQLTNIDFSFLHPKRGLLGESWHCAISLEGTLNEEGMLLDFSLVKKTLKSWLDTHIDHRLLVPTHLSHLNCQRNDASYISINWLYPDNQGSFHCHTPQQGVVLIDTPAINEQSLALYCQQQIKPLLPESIESLEIQFTPFDTQGAFYHYSHGLKKHQGNCQRIAHGHRSPIKIWLDNQRAPELEAQWANKWQDIYLGSSEDLIDSPEINGKTHHHYRYQATQGEFEILLPEDKCYLMPTDTTVEWIAHYIAHELAATHPGRIKAQAYEGILKGAICESP